MIDQGQGVLTLNQTNAGRIHAAKLEKSPRLQRFLAVLKQHPDGISTRDVQFAADVCNAHSCAAELNAPINNIPVDCERRADGYFYYRLKSGL
jgi:hypothetical protein